MRQQPKRTFVLANGNWKTRLIQLNSSSHFPVKHIHQFNQQDQHNHCFQPEGS